MSKAQFGVVVALLVGILGFVALPNLVEKKPLEVVPPKTNPVEWEYKIDSFSDETVVATLNELGAAGWEIVEARRAMGGSIASYEFILRRAK